MPYGYRETFENHWENKVSWRLYKINNRLREPTVPRNPLKTIGKTYFSALRGPAKAHGRKNAHLQAAWEPLKIVEILGKTTTFHISEAIRLADPGRRHWKSYGFPESLETLGKSCISGKIPKYNHLEDFHI